MRQILALTALLLRAYVRDRPALTFSLVVPLMLMVLFGYLNLGSFGRVNVVLDDRARSPDSVRFTSALTELETIRVTPGAEEQALEELRRTEADMLIVIPEEFRIAPAAPGSPPSSSIRVYANEARPQQVAAGTALISEVVDRLSFAASGTAPAIAIDRRSVAGVRLRYVDFLVPGLLGMNVMQLAVAGVAFGLVQEKQRGVLRRIMATPLRPWRFLAAHVTMRLVLAVAQVAVILGVAIVLFNVRVVGSLADLLAVSLLGSVLFLTQGFALAGWAQTENQVPAIVQLITLPQLFLSGVFFPKEAAPELVRPLTALLPLTFLSDALREVSVQGATLWDVRSEVLGLLAWTALGFALAVRFFRFEKA